MSLFGQVFGNRENSAAPSHTKSFLASYDFSSALSLVPEERFRVCIERIEKYHHATGYAQFAELPPVPPVGATLQELDEIKQQNEITLPSEYIHFLQRWRYLDIDTGLKIWGLSYQGVSIGSTWISEKHRPPFKYLVFGDYWNYADGDQLMFDLNQPEVPVVTYLHDHRLIEYFAPSFSLALWRMVDERCQLQHINH